MGYQPSPCMDSSLTSYEGRHIYLNGPAQEPLPLVRPDHHVGPAPGVGVGHQEAGVVPVSLAGQLAQLEPAVLVADEEAGSVDGLEAGVALKEEVLPGQPGAIALERGVFHITDLNKDLSVSIYRMKTR